MQFVFHEKGARESEQQRERVPRIIYCYYPPRSPFSAHSRNKDLLTAAVDSLKLVPDSKWIHPFQDWEACRSLPRGCDVKQRSQATSSRGPTINEKLAVMDIWRTYRTLKHHDEPFPVCSLTACKHASYV